MPLKKELGYNQYYNNDYKHKLEKAKYGIFPTNISFRQDKYWSLLEELILMDWSIHSKSFTAECIAKRVGKTLTAVYTKRNRMLDKNIEFFREIKVDDQMAKIYCQKANKFFTINGYNVIYDDKNISPDCKKIISIKGKFESIYISINESI